MTVADQQRRAERRLAVHEQQHATADADEADDAREEPHHQRDAGGADQVLAPGLAQQRRAALDRGPRPDAFGGRIGTTRKVAVVQARPIKPSISRPMKPSRSASARSTTPTVAEMTA